MTDHPILRRISAGGSGPEWVGPGVSAGLVAALALMMGVAWASAEPLRPGDWHADPDNAIGGRSAVVDGAMVFWTEEPLAQPAEDSDDQQILYYQGYVPRTGPYELRATVHLPAVAIVAHDPGAEVSFGFRPSGETEWRLLATQAVAPRDGLGAKAELIGKAANALVHRGDGGSIRDFEVVFSRPHLRSLLRPSGETGLSTLSWETEVGAVYSVWESLDLTAWSLIQGEVIGDGREGPFVHEPPGHFRRLFYRLSRN